MFLVEVDRLILPYHGALEMEVKLRTLPQHPYNDLLVGHDGLSAACSSDSLVPNYTSPAVM